MNTISINPTSRNSATTDEVVLREKDTTRLIFRPLIVNNAHDQKAAVKGQFVYQRKTAVGSWIDTDSLPLSKLRAGEWVKLELKSLEVRKLFQHLYELYSLHDQAGIPQNLSKYIKVEANLAALLELSGDELDAVLSMNPGRGYTVVARMMKWLSKADNVVEVVNSLETLGSNSLHQLNTLAGLSILSGALDVWHTNKNNDREEFWQQFLTDNAFVLSQVFSVPVVILHDKAYIGGKGVDNTGGRIVDFLLQNQLTRNVTLVEIKTPVTPLVSRPYRNTHTISPEVVGAVMQAIDYRDSLLKTYSNLSDQDNLSSFRAFAPEAMVIIGSMDTMGQDHGKMKAFDLFRNSLKDVRIITFDELFEKVRVMIELLQGGDSPAVAKNDETEIPF